MRHIHFEEIDSTNAFLKREYEHFDNLSFISSSFQTSGKGRENRVWESKKGENILFSFIIKDQKIIPDYPCLSTYTAMVIAEFFESKGLTDVSIKWPNDIYVKGKKICGILLEGSIPNYVIVGIGLNVTSKEFSDDLRHPATSMELELKNPLDVRLIQEELIDKIYSFWLIFKGKSLEYEKYLSTHNYLLDRRVMVYSNGEDIVGKVIGITSDNKLKIKTKRSTETVSSGEIKII